MGSPWGAHGEPMEIQWIDVICIKEGFEQKNHEKQTDDDCRFSLLD
jgi:hypothetical protein